MYDWILQLLPGLDVMPNMHPLFVHFPITFLAGFFLVDLWGCVTGNEKARQFAGILLALGAMSAVVTVASGLWAAHIILHDGDIHEVLLTHRNRGLFVLVLAWTLVLWRIVSRGRWRVSDKYLHLLAASVLVAVMAKGMDLGGLMVYGYRVGYSMPDWALHWFPGIEVMANAHPLFVHFPIAFLSTFFVVDLCGAVLGKAAWRQWAGWLLYLGTLSAGATAVAGLWALHTIRLEANVHDIMLVHRGLEISVLVFACLLSLWRYWCRGYWTSWSSRWHLVAAALLVAMMVKGADLGGLMVYGYGVGGAHVTVHSP